MFYALDEYPCLGSKGLSPYPDEWDDQQDMSPTRVRFTPASGALSGVDTWFEYYRGLNDLISAGGRAQIGVRTASVATFNGYNFDPQRAVNPVIAYDAVASLPVLGGLYNDFRAVVYNNKIRLFIAIYGNPSGSNRTAIFESTDGFTFTYIGEAQKGGTYLGRTIGALANVSGTLVSLVSIADGAGGGNGRQKWISLDGGLTWLDRGLAIHVGDEGDWNGLNYVGGTMQLEGDYYVALLPGMPFIGNNGSGDPYLDWPEAVGAFRIPAASILTADVLWEANSSNPLIIAGPTHNALWHMALFEDRGTTYSTVETWGVPGFESIGTATARALRTTPYYGTESRVSSSQLYELKMASRHWLDHWTTPVVANGTYTLRHVQSGKFVSVADGQPVLTEAGAIAEFAVERELSFYTISNADLCLSAIDDLMQTGFEFVENPGALDNVSGQWWIMPWEDRPADQPQLVVLTNRYSRLAASLPRDTETDGAPLVQAPFLGHASMIFELAAVVRAETTTEFPDPENPLLNMDLPAGNLLGSLGSDTAQHLAVVNIPRAEAVTRNLAGEWSALSNGTRMNFGGYWFSKLSGATTISDLLGWVPLEPLHIRQFASEAVLTANATAAIRAARLYARSLAAAREMDGNDSGLGVSVEIDMSGPIWPITAPLDGDGAAGVRLANGAFEVVSAPDPVVDVTWPNGLRYAYALVLGGADNDQSSHQGARNLLIDCKGLAAGIGAINTRGSVASDIQILNWRGIGLDVRSPGEGNRGGACDFQRIRGPAYPIGSTGGNLLANRNCIGLRDHRADNTYTDIGFSRCGVSSEIGGYGSHVHTDCHPFEGGVVDFPTYTVLDVTDNGGDCRIEVASTAGMTTGDLYVVPWLPGVSDVSFARANAYPITVDDGTHFTAVGCPFGGTFDTEADPPVVTPWAHEMICVRILPDATDVHFRGQLDRGKMQIIDDGAHGDGPIVFFDAFATGMAVDTMRTAIELVADGVTGAKFAGVRGTISGAKTALRLVGINGGSVSSDLRAQISTHNENGKPPVRTGVVTVPAGSASQPGLRVSRDPGYDTTAFGSTDGIYFDADGNMCTSAEQVGRTKFSPAAFEQLNNTALGTVLNPWRANLKMVSMRGTLADLIAADAAGMFDDLPEGAIVWVGQVPFSKQTAAGYAGLPVNFIPGMDYVSPKWWGGTWNGVANDTEVLRRAHAFANATNLPVSYAGIARFAADRDAEIICYNTLIEGHGAVPVPLGDAPDTPDFGTIATMFRLVDPDCPVVTGTATIDDANMVAGSMTPTKDFFQGPGFAMITASATGPKIPDRHDTALIPYHQSFCVIKDGQATKPLGLSMVGTVTVDYKTRAMPERGWMVVRGFAIDPMLCVNNCIFFSARNLVRIEKITVFGALGLTLPDSTNYLLRHENTVYNEFVEVNGQAMGIMPNPSSSYVISGKEVAETYIIRCNLIHGWGATGHHDVNGHYAIDCHLNRFDVHGGCHNRVMQGGSLNGWGAGYGWGTGYSILTGVHLINCPGQYHRADWGGGFWGSLITKNCTVTYPGFEAVINDLASHPVGSALMAVPLPAIITSGIHLIDNDDGGICPVAMLVRPHEIGAPTITPRAPRYVRIADVTSDHDCRMRNTLALEDMDQSSGAERTQVEIRDCPVSAGVYTTAALEAATPIATLHIPATTLGLDNGHGVDVRIDNCGDVLINAPVSTGLASWISGSTLVGNYQPADNLCELMGNRYSQAPVIKTGLTHAPAGPVNSAVLEAGTKIVGGAVQHKTGITTAWDFSMVLASHGLLIPAANTNCMLPPGASREQMLAGWTPDMVGQTVMIRQSADRTMAASTAEQAIFDEGGFSKVALAVGLYRFKLLYRVENMDATLASNLRFNPKGDGSATLAHILYDSAGRDATNLLTSASNLTGIMVAVEASLPLLNGVASANAGGTLSGYFEVTAAGTIRPSFKLDVGVAATVKADTFFECTKIASASVAGPWSA